MTDQGSTQDPAAPPSEPGRTPAEGDPEVPADGGADRPGDAR